ncbi:TetR/AcrR family transcriptional regulator [Pseudonocardia nematodicida]|uniref:TetR/AcrR family transcriptional regulator n=1 Tax=Pseudonocardia nematodicida TaxID=1206997 RepID=A0ABV1K6X2_9PSEU
MGRGRGPFAGGPEEARRRLVGAAEECFLDYGVRRTTMDDVARRAGVSRPTVYRYFSDRDALVVEVVTLRARAFAGRAREYIAGRSDFPSKIVDGLTFLVRGGQRDPILRTLLRPDNLSATSGILTAGRVAEQLSLEVWEPVLVAAQQAGEMQPDLDPRELCGLMADLELMLIGRQDLLDPDGPGVRDLVGEFLLPALVA